MKINDNVIKSYLKNVFFINGTACSGKSTICKMLAEEFQMIHCEENFQLDKFLKIATPEEFPNLCYLKTMNSWEEFVSRKPREYSQWLRDTADEMVSFELIEILSLPKDRLVIVDTNIPPEFLVKLCGYHNVAFLLSDEQMAIEGFFKREDHEKQFLLRIINDTPNPDITLKNFLEGIKLANGSDVHNRFINSGFKCFFRDESTDINIRYKEIKEHFQLK